ncbi:hypothetical protein JW859_03185 [bacterium]|nr:hypothetical protein [bacterium]
MSIRISLAALIAALLGCLLLTGCDTKNVGTGGILPPEPPQPIVTVPANLAGGVEATWVVNFIGIAVPFSIEMQMGGGTTLDVPAGTMVSGSSFSYTFMMVNPSRTDPATYTWLVRTTAEPGYSFTDYVGTREATGAYTVEPTPNNPPVIDNVTFADGVLSVYVSDADGDELTVTLEGGVTSMFDELSKVAVDGVAEFTTGGFGDSFISGGTGDVEITVTDDYGGEDTFTYTITIDAISIPAGALAAVPSDTLIQTGDTVTVVVIAGDFPAAAPFMYMNGAGITIEESASYVDDSLNVGAPGRERDDIDGIWAGMSSAPTGFLLPIGFMIEELPSNDSGRVRIDFNITPIGGGNLTTGGVLFNFALQFDHAGTYTLGFEEFNLVQRTYYNGADAQSQTWDDISNDYPDVPNTIEVT